MFKHLLVATDGSKLSNVAVKQGIKLAAPLGAKITFYCAVGIPSGDVLSEEGFVPSRELNERMSRETRNHLEKAVREAEKLASAGGVKSETVVEENFYPWKGVIDTAKKLACDGIVMASHGRAGLDGVLLGSVTQKVLAHSTVPVVVCR